MIRYVISFPAGVPVTAEHAHMLGQYLKDAADSKEWRDIVLTMGGTINELHLRPKPTPRYGSPRIVRARNRSRSRQPR